MDSLPKYLTTILFLLLLTSCKKEVELLRGLTQNDTNDICALLSKHNIQFTKTPEKEDTWLVSITDKDFQKSVELLRQNGLPRTSFTGFEQLYKKKGMVSSPEEEKARYYHALSQELSQTITQTGGGILLTRVHITPPQMDRFGELQLEAKASVAIVHHKDVLLLGKQPQYQNIVAHAVEGLRPENVKVTFFTEGRRSVHNKDSPNDTQDLALIPQ